MGDPYVRTIELVLDLIAMEHDVRRLMVAFSPHDITQRELFATHSRRRKARIWLAQTLYGDRYQQVELVHQLLRSGFRYRRIFRFLDASERIQTVRSRKPRTTSVIHENGCVREEVTC